MTRPPPAKGCCWQVHLPACFLKTRRKFFFILYRSDRVQTWGHFQEKVKGGQQTHSAFMGQTHFLFIKKKSNLTPYKFKSYNGTTFTMVVVLPFLYAKVTADARLEIRTRVRRRTAGHRYMLAHNSLPGFQI